MPSIVHEACASYAKGKPFEIVARIVQALLLEGGPSALLDF